MGTLSLVIASFLFAVLNVIFRFLPSHTNGFYVAFIRTFLMGILFFIVTLIFKDFSVIKRKDIPLFLLRSAFVVADFSTYYLAIVHLPLGTALFLTYAGTLLASYFYGFVIFRERITSLKFICLMMAILGLYLVFSSSIANFNSLMVFFAVFAGFFFGLTASSSKSLTYKYSINQVNFVTYFTAAILITPFLLLFKQPILMSLPLVSWLIFLLIGITSAIIYFLSIFGYKHQDASRASVILLLEIPFNIIVGYLFFKENLAFLAVLGGILIIIASALPDLYTVFKSKKMLR